MSRLTSEAKKTPALRYLDLCGTRITAIRKDMPRWTDIGERMAEPLLKGGRIFAPRVARYWPSEFRNRAGGLMGMEEFWGQQMSRNDVAYFALPEPSRWDAAEDKVLRRLIESKGNLFVNGREDEMKSLNLNGRFEAFTGGADPKAGFYELNSFKPLAGLRQFEQFIRGWSVAGEMIAACTRGGKMPIIWMSVWLEGALVRNASLVNHDNLKEPWRVPLFHEKRYIPPLAAGYAAGAFLDELSKIHQTLVAQSKTLPKAGAWLAEAKRRGKRAFTVAVGHSYPEILDLPEKHDYPLDWGHTRSDLAFAIPRKLGRGDVALHLGYAPVHAPTIERILDRGVRLIHTTPYGRPDELKDHENLIWFDLPWRPADATVDVPGYSVRILPMSSSAQTMALFAIVCEMAERMGWN